jgi:hypothetical protein
MALWFVEAIKMRKDEFFRIIVGRDYRFHQLRQVNRDVVSFVEDVELGLYRVLNFVQDGITLQCRVVYEGLDGADQGKWFTCSLNNFANRFRLIEDGKPPEELIPRVSGLQPAPEDPGPIAWSGSRDLDMRSKGSGV